MAHHNKLIESYLKGIMEAERIVKLRVQAAGDVSCHGNAW